MSEDWRKQLRGYADRIDAFSLRERALIFGGILAVLFTIAYNVVFAQMRAEQARLGKSVTAKLEQVSKLQAEVQSLSQTLAQDPDAANRARIAELKATIAATGEGAASLAARMVTPVQMSQMVQQILATNRSVKVVRVENIPPVSLLGTPGDTAKQPGTSGISLFQHGLRIEIQANYLDIVKILRAMETLPWRVYWNEVSIRTEKYPVSHASLVIFTINQDRAWIGI